MIASEKLELRTGLRPEIYRGGSGEPLVFLHAAGGLQPGDPFVDALAQDYSLVAPLAPGFNELEELDDIRDIHDLALHYDDLFQALGLDAVPVVGHSFGGMIAAELAAHVPSRVSKLVLIAPVGLWNDAYPVADLFATPLTEINTLLWGDLSSPAAQMAQAAFANADFEHAEALLDMLLTIARGFTSAGKFMWPIPDKGLSRRLHRITAPTLLIWGSEDKLVPPQYADDFAKGIENARKEILEGAGHMVTLERSDEVRKLIHDFL